VARFVPPPFERNFDLTFKRTTSTSVHIKNKVKYLYAIMKQPNRDDSQDSQLRQSMDELPNISGFNYRIARHKVGDDAYYRIHECFYDANGKVVLWGESSPHGETADALVADLEQMLADAKRSRDDIFDVPPDQP
jgi:hypothetical protein